MHTPLKRKNSQEASTEQNTHDGSFQKSPGIQPTSTSLNLKPNEKVEVLPDLQVSLQAIPDEASHLPATSDGG